MTAPTPSPAKKPPPQKTRRRWRKALMLLACHLVGFAIYFAWPVSPPEHSLFTLMPEDMAFGVEIRSGTTLWKKLGQDGLPGRLLASKLAQQLRPLLQERGISLEQNLRKGQARIDSALSRFWGQVGRSANGAVALATTDTRFKDAVLIAKLDHLASFLIRMRLWWSGKTAPGAPDYLLVAQAGRTLYLTYREGMVIGASSLERLTEAVKSAQGARSFQALFGQEFPPRESVVILANPNDELRDAVFRYGKTHAWTFQRGVSVFAHRSGQVQIRSRGYLHPLLVGALYREARAHQTRQWPEAPASSPPGSSPPPQGAQAWCQGWAAPQFAWHGTSRRVWEWPGRPLRGESRPMTVLFWEGLDEGVVAHSDGRFSLSIHPPAPTDNEQDASVSPPAPVLRARWGHQGDARVAGESFAKGARAIVDFYRSPGGSVLYQTVRQDTRLILPMENDSPGPLSGKVRLQPLFFNHMQPTWKVGPDAVEFASAGELRQQKAGAPLPAGPLTPSPGPGMDQEEVLMDLRYGWQVDPGLSTAVRALVHNKVVTHQFVKPERQPTAMRGVDLFLALVLTLPQGKGSLQLKRNPDSAEEENRFEVKADLEIMISPQ